MRPVVILVAFLLSTSVVAEDQSIATRFTKQGVEGALVLASLQTGQTFIHNDARAKRRFPSASTFKILNTLITIDRKAIAGADDILTWDGHQYLFPDWNRDQTLASAFKVSCVWCYQILARRVGANAYRDAIHQATYGVLREPFELTEFWLDGSLQVSAIEQVDFLRKVIQRSLPFSSHAYDILRDFMVVEHTPTLTIRAKTGWAMRSSPQIGWYVGYVETPNETWVFATNLDIRNEQDLPLRQQLTREALRVKGIME